MTWPQDDNVVSFPRKLEWTPPGDQPQAESPESPPPLQLPLSWRIAGLIGLLLAGLVLVAFGAAVLLAVPLAAVWRLVKGIAEGVARVFRRGRAAP